MIAVGGSTTKKKKFFGRGRITLRDEPSIVGSARDHRLVEL